MASTTVPKPSWADEARRICNQEIRAQARKIAGLARIAGMPDSTFRAYVDGRRVASAGFWIWLGRELYLPASQIRQWESDAGSGASAA